MTEALARKSLIAAWIGVGLIPVFAALGVAFGEVLAYWAGVPEGAMPDSPMTLLVALGPWFVVSTAPGFVAIGFGIASLRGGRRIAWIPVLLGAIAVLYATVLLILGVAVGPLGG